MVRDESGLGLTSTMKGDDMDYEISEKDVAPQLSLTRRETVTMKIIGDGLDAGFGALKEHCAATGAETTGPPFVFPPDFGKDTFDLIICMPVAPGAVAGEGVDVEENGRKPVGAAHETYLNDPKDVPESELLVEIAIPIT